MCMLAHTCAHASSKVGAHRSLPQPQILATKRAPSLTLHTIHHLHNAAEGHRLWHLRKELTKLGHSCDCRLAGHGDLE